MGTVDDLATVSLPRALHRRVALGLRAGFYAKDARRSFVLQRGLYGHRS